MFVRFAVMGPSYDKRVEFPSYEDAEMYIIDILEPQAVGAYYYVQKRMYAGVDPMIEVERV